MKTRLLFLLLFFLISIKCFSYWPTSVYSYLPVAADSGIWNGYSSAYQIADGNILVFYQEELVGACYQIIDKYGRLLLPQNYTISPALSLPDLNGIPVTIQTADKSVFACWVTYTASPMVFAQMIDSLGNRLWGDSGIVIFPYYVWPIELLLCLDNLGGVYVALTKVWGIAPEEYNVYIQRVTADGVLPWGPEGTLVGGQPNYRSRNPCISTDTSNGVFVVWRHFPGVNPANGGVYAQHVDSSGTLLWSQNLLLYTGNVVAERDFKTISDNTGGFILQKPAYSGPNTHIRYDGNGNILWQKQYLSWWYYSPMVQGEPGFIYMGFYYQGIAYGQRVDMNGNNYWPTYGSGQYGMPLISHIFPDQTGYDKFYFNKNNFTLNQVFSAEIAGGDSTVTVLYGIDTLGTRIYGENGFEILRVWDSSPLYFYPLIDDSNNITIVWTSVFDRHGLVDHDVIAKRINSDGTLGGPNAPIEDVIISIVREDVVLTWESMSDSAQYHIYRYEEPYVFPVIPDTTVSDTVYVDVGAVNEGVKFYRVTWEP